MASLEAKGKAAAAAKSAARIEKLLEQEEEPVETAIYEGVFDDSRPYGSRYSARIDQETTVDGEFITPAAPPEGARVAVYQSAPGKFLFDAR